MIGGRAHGLRASPSELRRLLGGVAALAGVYGVIFCLARCFPSYWYATNCAIVGAVALLVAPYLRTSPAVASAFGLTLAGWGRSLAEATAWTTLAIALLALVRTVWPGRLPATHIDVGPGKLVYLAVAFIQELLARGVLQGSLARLLAGPRGRWISIVLPSVVFGLLHAHLSLALSAASLACSIGWGVLYSRHMTLVGVTVSHFAIGVAVDFLGLKPLLWPAQHGLPPVG